MNADLTDITVILDRSGSMSVRRGDTIGGFNTFVAKQREEPSLATLTLVQFDDEYQHDYRLPIHEVPALGEQTYVPRGSTALVDAIARTIRETGDRLSALPEHNRPAKVIVVIITDGQENASTRHTRAQVFQMIGHQRDVYKWQFIFMGTNQDAIAEAGALNIPIQQAAYYAAGHYGTRRAYDIMSDKVGGMRGVSVANMAHAGTFTSAERSDLATEDTGPHGWTVTPEPQPNAFAGSSPLVQGAGQTGASIVTTGWSVPPIDPKASE